MREATADLILIRFAGALSLLAAALHGAVAQEHLEEWWGYGLFFILASIAQFVFGLLLLALPSQVAWAGPAAWNAWKRRLYWAGICGNAAIIGLYTVTRTVGIPFFGPDAGNIEPIGAIDVVSKATELALIGCLSLLLRLSPTSPEGRAPWPRST